MPVTATDNAYHVLTVLNATKNSTIDGFTVRDGYANGSTTYPSLYRGGAVLLSYDSANAGRPLFKTVSSQNNLAAQGGAVYLSQYTTGVLKTVLKCTFSQNYTYNNAYGERGGAICVDASPGSNGPFGNISLAIDSCIFQYNNSPNGAAILMMPSIKAPSNTASIKHNSSTTKPTQPPVTAELLPTIPTAKEYCPYS